MSYWFLLFALLINFSLKAECLKTRAAFDIGSGATKIKVAQVDTCQQLIKKELLTTSLSVEYKEDLQKSANGTFSAEIIKAGVTALKKLQQQAKELGAVEFYAVATSAARNAKNNSIWLRQIKKEVGLDVVIISQQQEAIIGHAASSGISSAPVANSVVWDIGGGSMQMTLLEQGYHIYEGKIASVSFKNHVLASIQYSNKKSPNPMSQSDYKQALHDVRTVAKFSVPDAIKLKLKDPKTHVVGIGGVHFYSIGGQLQLKNGQSYTQKALNELIPKRLILNDKELQSDYAATEVTNLILVEGFMQELGIKSVQIGQINLADGLLLSGKSLL